MIAMSNRLEDKPLIGENKFGVIESMITLRYVTRIVQDESIS